MFSFSAKTNKQQQQEPHEIDGEAFYTLGDWLNNLDQQATGHGGGANNMDCNKVSHPCTECDSQVDMT